MVSSWGAYHPVGVIQGMIENSHLGHQGLRHDGFTFVVLVVRGKLQLVDTVTKVMSDTLFLQVWDQFINVLVVRCLERTTRGEMDVSGDLVDTETTRDVATLVRLFLQLVCPAFFNALAYPIKNDFRRECTQGMHRPE